MNEYWTLVVLCTMWVLVVLSFIVGVLSYIVLPTFMEGDSNSAMFGIVGVGLVSIAVFIMAGCYIHVYG